MRSYRPKVSILMPVYNGDHYLREAIESILNQSYRDFEFLIIDDGSTDDTWTIAKSYADPRIRLVHNCENIGLTSSLNKGIGLALGDYIARQDADDVSLPHRLERQLAYLKSRPQLGLVGSWVQLIDTRGQAIGHSRPPTSSALLKWALAFQNHFTHSSVMFPRRVIDTVGPYTEEMLHAEDYELWWRISSRFPVANLPEHLHQRRITPGGIVDTYPELQREYTVKVVQRALSHLLGEAVPKEVASGMDRLLRGMPLPETTSALLLARLVRRCYFAYVESEPMSRKERQRVGQDAAEKLFVLAGKALARSVLDALVIAGWAERISFRLPALVTVRSLLWRNLSGKSGSMENL